MRKVRFLAIATILAVAIPGGAQKSRPQAQAAQVPSPPSAGTGGPSQSASPYDPANEQYRDEEKFCSSDPRTEVKAFCGVLSGVMRVSIAETKQGKTQEQIGSLAAPGLDYLDPATGKAQDAIVDVVSRDAIINSIQNQSQSVLQAANQMTTTQQLGAVNSAAGTTSLVSKAGGTAITNLAVDSGALTRSVSGSTATLTANTDEIFNLLTGTPEYDLNAKQGRIERFALNPLSLMASFSLNQNGSSTAPTSGQASGTTPTPVSTVALPSGVGKLSSFTAKYERPTKYNPRSKQFKDAWKNKELPTLKPLETAKVVASFNVSTQLEADPTYKALLKKQKSEACQNALLKDAVKADSVALMDDFEKNCWQAELGNVLQTISPSLLASVNAYVNAQSVLRSAYKKAILDAAGNMFSAQYTFNRPVNQPATHDVTAIYSRTFEERGSLTFNGAVSIYNGTLPPGAKYDRIHYGQASFEYDRNLNNPTTSYQTQLSFAGYWQYQPQPSVLNIPAGTVAPGTTIPLPNGTQQFVGTAGSLWVGQGKLTIKGPNGINIPLAISGSNKTDLLQGTKIGGQVGLSYNFSSLASLFGH